MRTFNYKYALSFAATGALPLIANAQGAEKTFYEQYQLEIVVGMAGVVTALALLSLVIVLHALRVVTKAKQTQLSEQYNLAPAEEGAGFWRKLWNRLNRSVPVAEEDTIITGHEYDGIRELDNRLPPWWLYGFYATIIFSVAYLLHFHVFNTGSLQQDEYEQEMARAKAEVEAYLASTGNRIDETNVAFSSEEPELTAGKEIYAGNCSACHGQQGEGGVGPNLTDQYWINGGDIQAIFKTIKYGVPSKGMIAWESQLTAKEMQQVSSFIYTLEGTNPPNAKEPQGELFERSDQEKDALETGL